MSEKTTVVFDFNILAMRGNPHHVATPFGSPVIVHRGDLAQECDRLEARVEQLESYITEDIGEPLPTSGDME